MLGLMVLVFFVAYFALSLWVMFAVLKWAAKNKRSGWWGILALFVMYNLVFWDWIPTVVAHKYYCATQAGFWVYKTPEQWMKENPELTKEDLKTYGELVRWGSGVNKPHWQFPVKHFENNPNRVATMINSRIYLGSKPNQSMSEILPVHKTIQFIADTKTDEMLAQQVAFRSGYGNPMTSGGLLGFKSWLANENCTGLNGVEDEDKVGLTRFLDKLVLLGEKND